MIEVDPGENNATITISEMDPADHLRNIHVRPEGAAPAARGEYFNPAFLDQLKGYKVLRFMIWMLGESSEDSAARHWRVRPIPQDAKWTVKGAPIEVMAALANRVHADPWFTVPHAADDDYVRRMAQLVKKTLDPDRKVYLE